MNFIRQIRWSLSIVVIVLGMLSLIAFFSTTISRNRDEQLTWSTTTPSELLPPTETALLAQPPKMVIPLEELVIPSVTNFSAVEIYQKVMPSVVSLEAIAVARPGRNLADILPEMVNGEITPPSPDRYSEVWGSGFVWNKEGYLVTCDHVIEDVQEIEVVFMDRIRVPAQVVGRDYFVDLAILKIDLHDLPADYPLVPATLGEAAEVQVGDEIFTIGNTLNFSHSLATGIISGLNREITTDNPLGNGAIYANQSMIQTTALVNHGNSGGVLINRKGEVIGVTSLRYDGGVAFAIDSTVLLTAIPTLITEGENFYPSLGFAGNDMDAEIARNFDLDYHRQGIVVKEVFKNSVAEKSGLRGTDYAKIYEAKIGDIIVAIDGQRPVDFNTYIKILKKKAALAGQQELTLTIDRQGQEQDLTIPIEMVSSLANFQPQPLHRFSLGVQGVDLTPELKTIMKIPPEQKGVLITDVEDDSLAAKAGLQGSKQETALDDHLYKTGGDVIVAWDDRVLGTKEQLQEVIALYQGYYSSEAEITVLRDGQPVKIKLTFFE